MSFSHFTNFNDYTYASAKSSLSGSLKNMITRYGGSVGMMTGAMNIGLFAYPLIEVIWPKTGLIYFGMADIGGAFVMFANYLLCR